MTLTAATDGKTSVILDLTFRKCVSVCLHTGGLCVCVCVCVCVFVCMGAFGLSMICCVLAVRLENL